MSLTVNAPRLRYVAGSDPARKVTWLELFFDLIFVAAVAQVGEPLREDYSLAGLIRYSVGIEDTDDLIADLAKALERA